MPKIIHTRQRKAPLRGARLCYRTAHTCKETPTAWRQHHAKRSSSSWRAMQLNHAACMSAGTCAATAEAGRAWLSRQEQQEDELRTTGGRAGGRWPILAFWLLFWENSHELTSMEAMFGWVFGKVKSAIFRFKNAKFSSRGSAPHPAGARAPDPPLYSAPPSVSKGPSITRESG